MVIKTATCLLALGVAVAACKYDPNPPEGTQQCYQGKCVDGYVCYDGLCYTPASLPVPPGSGGATVPPAGTGGKTTVGTGGVVGSGGTIGSGGMTTGSGGLTGRGGASASGGVTGTGGVTSTGGTTTPPNAGTIVTIANNQAQGAMTGFGWIALGTADTLTDPTCSSPAGPITSGTNCGFTLWSSTTAYCMSGYIPALPAAPTSADYTANWGIQLGINSTPVSGGPLGQSFTSIAVATTGTPQTGLRIIVHRKGDATGTSYCANMTPGTAVLFTSFNTACWDGSGTKLVAADVANLDQIGIQVSSTATAITITNLCVVGITFGK